MPLLNDGRGWRGCAVRCVEPVELEKLACAAVGAPHVAGLADAGGKAAERFKTPVERW